MEALGDILKVKNGYTNTEDRASFSLEILKCSGDDCESDPKISSMLDKIMFNIFILSEDLEIGNIENYGTRPLITTEKFHS